MGALLPPYMKLGGKMLPAQGSRCKRCGARSWARPERVLYILGRVVWQHGEPVDTTEYREVSGYWILCTKCVPPRRWVSFFRYVGELDEKGGELWRPLAA